MYVEAARRAMAAIDPDAVSAAARLCAAAVREGGRLLVCGNGGSAADAQHMAGELVGRFRRERRPLPVVALTSDSAVLTAIGNDYGFEEVFSRQVEALGSAGDVLVAISTSGRSENVLRAASAASRNGMRVLALTGSDGGSLAEAADVAFRAPTERTSHVQEVLMVVMHAVCLAVELGVPGHGEGAGAQEGEEGP